MNEAIDVSSGPILVKVGKAYRLQEDIHGYTPSGRRRKAPYHRKGDVYVCSREGIRRPVLRFKNKDGLHDVSEYDGVWDEFVRLLVEIPHDVTTALTAAACHSDELSILEQLVASGDVTLEQVVRAAKLNDAHGEANRMSEEDGDAERHDTSADPKVSAEVVQ